MKRKKKGKKRGSLEIDNWEYPWRLWTFFKRRQKQVDYSRIILIKKKKKQKKNENYLSFIQKIMEWKKEGY